MTRELHYVSFSGGKDSTAMLLMMIEKGMPITKIINVDTGKEYPEMYEHIEQVREYIKPYKIITVKMDFDYFFKEVPRVRPSKYTRGYGFPGIYSRWCTRLKIMAINSVIMSGKSDPRSKRRYKPPSYAISYIGITTEEYKRIANEQTIRYPLVEWGVTGEEALEYCYDKGFTWNGLYTRFKRSSCWCCPFQRISDLYTLYRYYPDLWWQLEEMDKISEVPFNKRYLITELGERFFHELEKEKLENHDIPS